MADSKHYQITEHYSSISALARHCAATKGRTPYRAEQSVNHSPNRTWCMKTPINDAIDMGLTGGYWPEGAADLQSVDVSEQAHKISQVISPAIEHDITGGFLDVPEYLAGQSPEVFMRVEEQSEDTKPVISIGVCAVPRANIKASELMNQGRAILALIDALEMKGYSAELFALFIAHTGTKNPYIASTTVKGAGQPWDASSAAFALAHPAFSRRLGFRALEFNEQYAWVTEQGYGNGRITRPDNYDLFFPYLEENDVTGTPEKALKYVQKIVKNQRPDLAA